MHRSVSALLTVAVTILLAEPSAHAFGLEASVGGRMAIFLDAGDFSQPLIGYGGRLGAQWQFGERYTFVASLGMEGYPFKLNPRTPWKTKWAFEHTTHFWVRFAGEADSTHFFVGPSFGLSMFDDCSGDNCGGGIGLAPGAQIGIRTPLGGRSRLVVLYTTDAFIDGFGDPMVKPGIMMGFEL